MLSILNVHMSLPFEIDYSISLPSESTFELNEMLCYTKPCFTREDVLRRLPKGDFSDIPGFAEMIDAIVDALNDKDFYEELSKLKIDYNTKDTTQNEQAGDNTIVLK
jgi:hypothetical protein